MMKTIGAFGRQWEAGLAIALLSDRGLHAGDLLTASHAVFGGAEPAYYVTVPEAETDAAIALLGQNGYEGNVVPQA
jgi:hypothetical protein